MAYHGAHFTEHPAREIVWRVVASHLAPLVPESGAVVELGAAYCHWINNIRAARRVAVDLWTDLPRYAGPGVESAVGDVRALLPRMDADTFDVALASNVLEHLTADDAGTVAKEVWRVLKPGGRFVLVQPNFRYAWRQYFDDYTHRSVFTDVSLPNMLKSKGFVVRRVEPRFLPYSMRDTRVPLTAWMVRAYLLSPLKPMAGQMLVVAEKETPDVR